MEKLQIIQLGSVSVEQVEFKDQLDRDFKPGLFRQTQAFLESDNDRFCTLADQVKNAILYCKIAGYSL